jgi:glucose-6-phosphate isomerase
MVLAMARRSLEQVRMPDVGLAELMGADPDRAERLVMRVADLRVDLSRQPVTDETLGDLVEVADACGVAAFRDALLAGDRVNRTEDRAVAHPALRAPLGVAMTVDGRDVGPEVHRVLDQMSALADRVRADGRITDVVNIGIGGSDLGPAMATRALAPFARPELRSHFVSNVDGAEIAAVLGRCRPESTLFVVVSKTFTTVETLANARTARDWLVDALGEEAVADHFVAVSTALDRAADFGIPADRVLGFWDWVGGRYSVWSAVGFALMVAIGPDSFREFLAGGRAVDEHVMSAPARENVPLLMALIGVMHRNLLGRSTKAVLPYSALLDRFPAYLQQLDMESNGKSIRIDGSPVEGPTGPVVWGEPGTNGQHAFFQLLHQGTDVVPVDVIGFARPEHELLEQHDLLMANLFAQVEALALGRPDAAEPHRRFAGGRPSTVILAERLTPSVLGQLIALYEWLVIFQGALWGVPSFDQWGVELGKELAGSLGDAIRDGSLPVADPSTAAGLAWYRAHRR